MSVKSDFQALEGLYTLDLIMEKLGIARQTALNLLSKYKKLGYVAVSGGRGNKRIYKITRYKQAKEGVGLFDVLNKYSKIKLWQPYEHRHFGKYTMENVIIDAFKYNSPRVSISTLSLFRRVTNWSMLYNLAKKNNLLNYLGAMYESARLTIKMPKMDEKTYNALLRNCKLKEQKAKTISEIEKRWKIRLGFNEKDLGVYKK